MLLNTLTMGPLYDDFEAQGVARSTVRACVMMLMP
jgi:hypothetical protein